MEYEEEGVEQRRRNDERGLSCSCIVEMRK